MPQMAVLAATLVEFSFRMHQGNQNFDLMQMRVVEGRCQASRQWRPLRNSGENPRTQVKPLIKNGQKESAESCYPGRFHDCSVFFTVGDVGPC